MSNIDSYRNDNNKNKQIQNKYWIWLIAYIGIGLAISFILPFPISFGIKELYKSMSSSFDDSSNNNNNVFGGGGLGYSPIKFYCMNCGYEHRKNACPKCSSKAVRVG